MINEREKVLLTASSTTPYGSKPWRRASSVVCHARPLLNRYLRKCVEVWRKMKTHPMKSLDMSKVERNYSVELVLRQSGSFPKTKVIEISGWKGRRGEEIKSRKFLPFLTEIFSQQSCCGCAWGCRWSVKQTEHTARQGTLTVETFVAGRQRVLISQVSWMRRKDILTVW